MAKTVKVAKNDGRKDSVLAELGERVRAFRSELNLTVKEFAERAELSPRFVNQLESGVGNISVGGLARVGQALGRSLSELLPPTEHERSARARVWRLLSECDEADFLALEQWLEKRRGHPGLPRYIALIGSRGVGKSTIGLRLAERLKKEFVELDRWIEDAAGLTLGEIFTMHDESYYRRLEREGLARLFSAASGQPGCVFAPGGSIVTETESWELVKRRCFTVWLSASPEEILKRLRRQGDLRSIQGRPTLMDEMKALLARRAPFYAEAQLALDTTGKTPDKVVGEILKALTGDPEKHDKNAPD
ncbi:MAG TPA: shikimate kinase [Blastocatellia bacterium]|nr:shikimate kinase [Blastocatellia bacterium]